MRVYDVYLRTAGVLLWMASFAERHEAERFKRMRPNPNAVVIRNNEVVEASTETGVICEPR